MIVFINFCLGLILVLEIVIIRNSGIAYYNKFDLMIVILLLITNVTYALIKQSKLKIVLATSLIIVLILPYFFIGIRTILFVAKYKETGFNDIYPIGYRTTRVLSYNFITKEAKVIIIGRTSGQLIMAEEVMLYSFIKQDSQIKMKSYEQIYYRIVDDRGPLTFPIYYI